VSTKGKQIRQTFVQLQAYCKQGAHLSRVLIHFGVDVSDTSDHVLRRHSLLIDVQATEKLKNRGSKRQFRYALEAVCNCGAQLDPLQAAAVAQLVKDHNDVAMASVSEPRTIQLILAPLLKGTKGSISTIIKKI
jgi:hypothetical protein